jgi:Outer membrane protein
MSVRWLQGLLFLILVIMSLPAVGQNSWQPPDAKLAIAIDGVQDELLANSRIFLSITALEGETVPSIFRVRYLTRQGEQEIRSALEPFGFYNATVTSEIIETDELWTVRYQVDVGPVTTYDQVNFEMTGGATNDDAFQKVIRSLRPVSGQVFNHQAYERFKATLRNLAAERGYYDADFLKQSVKVETSTQVANVELVFDSGERYLFGETSFCCAFLNNSLLERFIQYQPGEPFTTRALLDLQVDLAGSDYFNRVEVAPLWQNTTDNRVPIDVTLSPNERDRYQVGLGYGTDTGARVTLGFDRRWVNDRGHRLSSVIRLSEVQNTGFVSYIIPGNNPARDSYSFNGEITDRSFEEQRSTLYKTSFKDLRHYDRWHRTYQLAYQREDFAFGEEPTESSNFLIPSVEWSLIESSNLPVNRNIIDDGYRLSIMLQGGHDGVLSDTTFASIKVGAKWIHRLNDQWRILLRSEVGALRADDFEVLGPTLRFFAGGDHSVRGYAYQQLGPESSEGVVIGGKYMTASSVEVDYAFKPNWRVALFTDIGNSMMNWDERLKQTVGFGFRWVSPIGPVRLDLAMALDEPSKPWRLHLTLGPDL